MIKYKDSEYGLIPEDQTDMGLAETISMSANAPAIAKRIFDTYEHAKMFIENKDDTAIAGLILSVFRDTTPSYELIRNNIGKAEKDRLISESNGGYQETTALPDADLDTIGDNLIIPNEDKVTYSSYKKVIGAKNGIYQVLEDPLHEGDLTIKKVGNIGLGKGLEEDNIGRPKIKIDSTIFSTTDADGKLIQNEMLTVSDQGLRFNIVTDMGMYNLNSLTTGNTEFKSFKESLQLFRNKEPFLPTEGKTALQTAKFHLNKIFSTDFMEMNMYPNTARMINQNSFSFKDGEPIAVYYKEEDDIVRIAIAIVYVNFEQNPIYGSKKPISLSWFSNDDEQQETTSYRAGDGIKLDDVTNSFSTDSSIIKLGEMTDDPDLKGSFKVTNPIGNFKLKEEVTIDTAVKRIIVDMLTKLEDVKTELPSTSFELYSNNGNIYKTGSYEVGSIFEGTLKYKYPIENRGKFTGWWLNEPTGYQYAECEQNENSKYTFSGILKPEEKKLSQDITYNFEIDEGKATISLDLFYNDSIYNNNITQNDGKTLIENKILSNKIPTITKNYIGQFKYFIGTFKQASLGEDIITEYNQLFSLSNLSTNFCTIDGTTKISKFGSTSETPTIVLAVPSKYKNITKTCNDFGQEIDLNINNPWVKQKNTIMYTNGNKTTEYTIYIQYLTDGTIYRNIEFGV